MHCESRTIRTITTKYSDSDGNVKSRRRAELSGKSATYEGEYSETDEESEESANNKNSTDANKTSKSKIDNGKPQEWMFGRQKIFIPNIELKPVKMFEYSESIDDDGEELDENGNPKFNREDMHNRISENLASKLNMSGDGASNKSSRRTTSDNSTASGYTAASSSSKYTGSAIDDDDNDPNLVSKESKQYQTSDIKSIEKLDEKTGILVQTSLQNEVNTNEDIAVRKINKEENIQQSDDCIVKKITTKTLTTKKITKTTTTTTKKG